SNCIYRCTDDKAANHAVIIVGYNDTGNESTSYWIVKNSWGSDWPSGECNMGGYFKLGFNECNLTDEIEYVLSVNPPNFKPKVVLNSPENGTKLPPQVFKFNFTVYTKNSTTAQCDLLINEEVKNTTSTQNSTPTVISYNLTPGIYEWKVACWENKIGILNSSETRVLTASYEINVFIQSPQNTTYASLPISLNVTTDTPADSCWWNPNDTENTTMSNSSQTSWYDSIDSCAPGTQHLFVYCNNTQGDVSSNSSVWFTYDPTPPKYYNETSSPLSPTSYSPHATYIFNITWLETESELSEVWIEHNFTGAMQNVTVTNESGNVYTFTFSDLPAGTYVYRWHANNSVNEMNSSPFYTYTVEKASRTLYLNFDKPSPQEYGTSLTVSCFVSQGGGEVKLYRNVSGYVDVSEENNESVILPAGAWSYLCNVTEGENYTSASNSSIFVVTKASPQLFLESNCSWNAVYETVCNQTGFVTSGDASAIKKLYRNESGWVEKAQGSPASEVVMLGVGSHQYNYTYEESENYSTKNVTNILVINPKNARVRVYPQTQTIPYGQSVTQFCLDDSALLDCSLYRNGSLIQNNTQVTLPAGVYTYSANISDSQNYTNYENFSILTVEKALPQGSISGTNVTYPNSVNVVPLETNSGDADVNYTLWRNGTLVSSALGSAPSPDIAQLPAGTYIYVFNSSGGENYSSATISTLTVIVNKAPTSIKLYLNGSEWVSNQTFEYPHATIANATINVSSLQPNVTLLVNSSPVSNPYETLHTPGTYNYTAIFEGNENYTSSSIARFLTIQDTTPPNISSASAFPTVVAPNENVTVFAEVNDNFGVKYVYIEVYNSSSNLVYEENLTQESGRWMLEFNMSFPQGKYILNLTAVDNSGLESTEWVKNVTVNQSSAGEVFENTSVSTHNNFTTINTPIDVSLEITTTLEIENFTIIAVRYLENPVGEESQPSLKYIEVGTTPEVEESLLWNVLKVYYTDEEVSSAGLEESSLRIYYYNETSEEWDLEPGGVNTTSNYVWCNVTHFSVYGVFGQTATSTTSTSTTVGGGGGGSVVRSETSSTTSTSTTVKPRAETSKETTSSTSTTTSTSTTYIELNSPSTADFMIYIILLLMLLFLLIVTRRFLERRFLWKI
ncbi:MAG TPA: hypothetical protein ENF95_00495, partial [Candidatus Aenigmarchaeota archaeon]|nr:hypothetical protein [Candidatus Aenigmarchaeota archaeon]